MMKLMRTSALLIGMVATLTGCKNEVEEAVKLQLIDGTSAQFRDVNRCSGDPAIYNGQVNAKNRMGAYTGFEPFFYDGTSVAFTSSANFMPLMGRCYADHSKETGDPTATATASPIAQETESTAWSTSEDVNPVDDSKTHRALLIADEGASSMGDSVVLTIRCQSNQTELYVNWNDYLGDDSHDVYDEWKNVTVRVGNEEAKTQRWSISTDSKATFAPGSPVALIKQMVKADRLVLQTTPYNENPVTAVFKLKGMEKAITPIAKGCGWQI